MKLDEKAAAEIKETDRLVSEFLNSVGSLYRQIMGCPGSFTADQQSQWTYYQEVYECIVPWKEEFHHRHLPRVNGKLTKEDRILVGEMGN